MKRSKKLARKARSRIHDWETMMASKGSDALRKHPTGFHKPGSNK